jgi:hypothetical protein
VRARLLELLLGQIIALVPLGALWWFAYLDDEDREDRLERVRAWGRHWSGLELRDWLESPGATFARATAGARIAEEFVALGVRDQAGLDAFVAGLDATVDELEAEGIA